MITDPLAAGGAQVTFSLWFHTVSIGAAGFSGF